MRVSVICRDCSYEQLVTVGEPGTIVDGFYDPDCCRRCESTNLAALRDFTREELEEIERETQL